MTDADLLSRAIAAAKATGGLTRINTHLAEKCLRLLAEHERHDHEQLDRNRRQAADRRTRRG